MHRLRLFVMLLMVAALTGACGGTTPGASNAPSSVAGQTQPPTVTQPPTQTLPPGGGGGGANGSIIYQLSGAYTASGELPFVPLASVFVPTSGGWVASFTTETGTDVVQLNTQTAGQIFNFSNGTASVIGTSDPGSGSGCTFTLTKNDPSGLAGSVVCTSALVTTGAGTIERAVVSAQWNAHP